MNPNDKTVEELQADISTARAWAIKHFNANAEQDTPLDPPSFQVEFPNPDTMMTSPRMYGRPLGIWIEYRLCWKGDGTLSWKGINPLTNNPMPELIVPQ